MTFLFTEDVLIMYLLNFIALVSMLMCQRWFRDYVQLPIAVSIALVLALPASMNTAVVINNSLFTETILSLFRGISIGLPLALALEMLPFAGRVMDISRGMQFAEINLGISRNSILEGLLEFAAPLFFFKLDLHLILLKRYYDLVAVKREVYIGSSELLMALVQLSSEGLKKGIQIAFPIMVVSFSVELIAIITSRAVGRVNLSSELAPVKSLVSLFALYLACELYPQQVYFFLATNGLK